jgi:hypothetical protein
MISDRSRGIQQLVLLSQCLLVTAAFWLWFLLCYHLPIDREAVGRYVIYNEFVLLGLLIGGRRPPAGTGLHSPRLEETSRQSFRQLGGTLFYLLLYLVAAHDGRISRLFLFSFIPLLYLILFVTNRGLPALLGRLTFRREMTQKVILMGPRHKALELQAWLDKNKHLGLEIMGLLTDDPDETTDHRPQTTDRNSEVSSQWSVVSSQSAEVSSPWSVVSGLKPESASGNGSSLPAPCSLLPSFQLSALSPLLTSAFSFHPSALLPPSPCWANPRTLRNSSPPPAS